MSNIKLLWKCLFSPTLYTFSPDSRTWRKYDPEYWERIGDNLVTSIFLMWNVGVYSSPVFLYFLFNRGYLSPSGAATLVKISLGFTLVVGASYCIRSYGRTKNSDYLNFLSSINNLDSELTRDTIRRIKNYDFEFNAWPVEYKYSQRLTRAQQAGRTLNRLVQSPCSLITFLFLHSFGIRLIYPGSIRALNYVMTPALTGGRRKLVEQDKGERFKVIAADGNYIDTMFIDSRGRKNNGSTLVICSEGNAGFYEVGIMVTPIEAGYSVLGWNHPGFGGSSGMPYPDEEQSAIDAVLQFAINHLKFTPENIILFGWSIGGYTTSIAAMNYPEVKAVIVDATFDDILPLALQKMPAFLEGMVKKTIRQHANLDVARYLVQYPGPVLIVRRSEDEIIALDPTDLATNRGNYLLWKLLKHRYPQLFTEDSESALLEWLNVTGAQKEAVLGKYKVDNTTSSHLRSGDVSPRRFPSTVGEGLKSETKCAVLLYLANKYMTDYKSTHCTPLPSSMFWVPTLH